MALVLAWPVGWICDRVQRSKVLLVILITATFLSLGVALQSEQPFLLRLGLLATLLGTLTLINSLAVALVHDRIDSSARVAASSALMLSYGVGSIIGPLGGSVLMEAFAPQSMFIAFAILLVGLSLYVRYRQNQMPPLPVAAQEQYVASMPETQLSDEFDPRYEVEEETTIEDIFPDEWVEAWGPESEETAEDAAEELAEISEEIEVGEEILSMPMPDATPLSDTEVEANEASAEAVPPADVDNPPPQEMQEITPPETEQEAPSAQTPSPVEEVTPEAEKDHRSAPEDPPRG